VDDAADRSHDENKNGTAMSRKFTLRPANPLLVLGLSVLLFASLDAAIFRSGFYANFASLRSAQGMAAHLVRFERDRAPSGKKEVLLIGHSKMGRAFELPTFREEFPESNLFFVKGAKGGMTLKLWFYVLSKIDPHRDRYAALVIPLEGFQGTPRVEDYENSSEDIEVLAAQMTPWEWRDFLSLDTDENAIRKAYLIGLLPGHAYAQDVQSFLLDPLGRLTELREELNGAMISDDLSPSEDISELRYDAGSGKILAYPSFFDAFKRRESDNVGAAPKPEERQRFADRFAAYQIHWAERYIAAYRASPTKLAFVYMPHRPVPIASQTPLPGAQDIRETVPQGPHVFFLDPAPFQNLEKPELFADLLHLNHAGAKAFTEILTRKIEEIIGD
jgi:hypothetical protein